LEIFYIIADIYVMGLESPVTATADTLVS